MTLPVAIIRSSRSTRRIAIAGRPSLSRSTVQAMSVAGEAGLVVVASLAARLLVELGSAQRIDADVAIGLGCVAAVLHMIVGQALGLHRLTALLVPNLERVALAVGAMVLLLAANVFVLKAGADVSGGYLAVFAAALLPAAGGFRLAQARILTFGIQRQVICGRPAVLIGLDGELECLSTHDLFRQFGLSEITRVRVPRQGYDDASLDRASSEALSLARVLGAEDIVVAVPWANVGALARLERGLRRSPLPVWLLPDASARSLMMRHRTVRGVELVTLQPAPLGTAALAAKRIVDLLLASCALLILAPLLMTIAAVVRLDSPGPALFRQRRSGFDQRAFTIYKFRTMTVMEDNDAVLQAGRADARVTRVGRVLRRTSLDELPQLLNVLRGEMALVGPRPHALAHDRQFDAEIDDYCVRHRVKPGITGWAQVNGLRGETGDAGHLQRRVAHDLWYVNNWSLGLDLRILVRTCREVLTHDAY